MREINAESISEAVKELVIRANKVLPRDIETRLSKCAGCESCPVAGAVLGDLCENLKAARALDIPICQDTGMAVIFAEIGQDVHITGGGFESAVHEGVRRGYTDGLLRKSVVNPPLFARVNTGDNTPAVIHTRIVAGDKIKLTAAPKGFGSENMSSIKMFTPAAGEADIIDYIVNTVKTAGSNPCPPVVVGVGIGGDFEYCALLSKRALCRNISVRNADARFAKMEEKALKKINALGIGPQGFGGDTTALAVNIEAYPTHIASIPVAVNMGCNVTRHASAVL